jgi:futalosine hydrolase
LRRLHLDLWVLGALPEELELLVQELGATRQGDSAGLRWFLAEPSGMRVGLGVTGVGIASACVSLGVFLSVWASPRAVMVGSCGALPGSGLELGDLVVGSSETFSELGVVDGPGTAKPDTLSSMGLEQEIALGAGLGGLLLEACHRVARARLGGLLTVAGVSATRAQARARGRRFGTLAENMEGYALALAARRMGVEASEVRGVSNMAGERDKALWDLEGAQSRAQRAVLALLERSLP